MKTLQRCFSVALVMVMVVGALTLAAADASAGKGKGGGGGNGGGGGGGGGPGGGDPPPCPENPIEVLVENNCGKSMWVTVNDPDTACNIVCHMTKKKKQTCPVFITWIGGIVVADPADEHGFHFDPDTVLVGEVTAEGLQTNICQISNLPSFYDGGLWYIPAGLAEYNELVPAQAGPPTNDDGAPSLLILPTPVGVMPVIVRVPPVAPMTKGGV